MRAPGDTAEPVGGPPAVSLEHLVAEVLHGGDNSVGGQVVGGLGVGPAVDASPSVAGERFGLAVDGAAADPSTQHTEAVAGQFAGEPVPRPSADIPALLDEAMATHGPLPDELPTAALWWRLADTLVPAPWSSPTPGYVPPGPTNCTTSPALSPPKRSSHTVAGPLWSVRSPP